MKNYSFSVNPKTAIDGSHCEELKKGELAEVLRVEGQITYKVLWFDRLTMTDLGKSLAGIASHPSGYCNNL